MRKPYQHILAFFFTLLTSACAQQTAGHWDYSSFSDTPEMSLNRAQTICKSSAINAYNTIPAEQAASKIVCNQYNASSISCRNDNGMEQLTANIRTTQRRKDASDAAYSSCMAQYGWNAQFITPEPTYALTFLDSRPCHGGPFSYDGPSEEELYDTCEKQTGKKDNYGCVKKLKKQYIKCSK